MLLNSCMRTYEGKDRILFQGNQYGNSQIFSCNLDGSEIQTLTDYQTQNAVHPSSSPDGTKICYAEITFNIGIWTMDIDGSNKKKVFPDTSSVFYPTWSPDGEKIIFFRSIDSLMYIISLKDGTATPLTAASTVSNLSSISWSIDNLIVFTDISNFGHFYNLTTGSNQNTLSGVLSPSFSSDGTSFIYTNSGSAYYLYSSNTQMNATQLANFAVYNAAWSPNGKYIVFDNNASTLFVYSLDSNTLLYNIIPESNATRASFIGKPR